MNTPHTPGPWNFSHGRISSRAHQTSRDLRLAVICDLDMEYDPHGEQAANARLIAAAPELLAASSELLEILRDMPKGPQHDAMVKLHHALAKATL
jgi:hypothetical protein